MSDAEINSFLREQGTGVLALADENEAYGVPISFGYGDGRIVFVYWQFGTDSLKLTYSEATDRACLTVYDVQSAVNWRSVLVFGPLREIPINEWSEVGELVDENAWAPDLSVLKERQLSPICYELTVEETTGLQGEAYSAKDR